MTTEEFLDSHLSLELGYRDSWLSTPMHEVYDQLIKDKEIHPLVKIVCAEGVFPRAVLYKLMCRAIRETPLYEAGTTWVLLPRWDAVIECKIRKIIEDIECFANRAREDFEEHIMHINGMIWFTVNDIMRYFLEDRRSQKASREAMSAVFAMIAISDFSEKVWSCLRYCTEAACTHAEDSDWTAALHDNRALSFGELSVAIEERRQKVVDLISIKTLEAHIRMIADLGNPFKKGDSHGK